MNVLFRAVVISSVFGVIQNEIYQINQTECGSLHTKILYELFKEKKTVLTISREAQAALNCLHDIAVIRLNEFSNILEQRKVPKNIMIDYDMTTGIIFSGNLESLMEDFFPKLAKFNPKTRTLVIVNEEIASQQVKKMLSYAWYQLKLHDVYLAVKEDFDKHFEALTISTFDAFAENQLVEIIFSDAFDGFGTLETFQSNRYRNLSGHRLKVVLFPFMMVSDGQKNANGSFKIESLRFQDGEILKVLAKAANFTVDFVTSPDGINHGYQTSNFTFTGSLGMVEYEQVDFAANSRLIAEYNTSNTLCLFPTTAVKLKFAVPLKLWTEVNMLTNLYNFVDDKLKISIVLMFLLLPILISTFEYLNCPRKNSFEAVAQSYLMFYAIMTFVSVKLPHYWPSRYVTGAVVIVWLIIGNTYAGKMIEFLNTNFGLKQIGSIEEMTRTNLEVKIPYPMAILFEGSFENATKSHMFINKVVTKSRELERIGDKNAFIDVANMGEMIRSRRYALLFLDHLLDLLEKSFFDRNGNDILTHIEETPYEYYYATSVPKTSPFVQRFNELLMRIFEAGIAKYQMSSAVGETDLIRIRRIKAGQIQSTGVKQISLEQLKSVFGLYAAGMTICFIIFFLEFAFEFIRSHLRSD